jgi:type VI secretion system secreted protein VgrG
MPPPITLTSPLPDGDLLFESMTSSAGLSMLGETRLNLLSSKPDLKPEDLLGQPVTVTMLLRDDAKRYLNGYVTRFGIGAHRGRYYSYQAVVSPWLWFLTRTADCRIFQDLSVPDIVKKVFEDSGVSSFEFKLFRTYRKWVYCVQYRESDYNFVARLLEHEGIYWYFEHQDGAHKLTLVDSHSAHDAAPSCESLPFIAGGTATAPDIDCISEWTFAREVRSGKFALASYDFERPSTDLKVKAEQDRSHSQSTAELFDFQGDYILTADGSQLVDDRRDEVQTAFESLQGHSNAQGIEVGRLLKLTSHPRDDQNQQYLITGLSLHASVDGYESGNEAGGFQCDFTAVPAAQQFRPPRRTPKPFVQGPQTALVVGPSGEEIFTDKYGRVKVEFHWDRLSKRNETSSCWVRVSHPWAGKNFGVIHLPRIGQEVVVDFLEGDPDQPIVTGRVYNAEQMPPWDLPANATQSGILTRSSKGGGYGNANALRFEDKKGSEQVWLHAEKNQDIEVENDETHWVGHDRTKTIDHDETTHVKHDRTETVDNNETITIHGKRTETVDKDETITIHQNRIETVDANETIKIGGSRSEQVAAAETIKIGSNRSETVGSNETVSIGASQTITVAGSRSDSVGGTVTQKIGGSLAQTVTGGIKITTPGPMTIMANGGFTVVAPGGTKTVDQFFDQTGGAQSTAFGMTLAVAGAATAISAINWQYQAVSFGFSGFKNEIVSCAITATGVKIDTTTLDMSNGGVEFRFKALFLLS